MSDAGRALRGVTDRDSRAVLRKAMKAGCEVGLTGSTHVRIVTPSGVVVTTGLTSSSRHAHKMLRAALRRAGVAV